MTPLRSSSHVRRRALLLVGVGVLLVCAGCSGIAEDDPDIPSGAEVADEYADIGVYNATLVFRSANDTVRSTVNRTVRPATGERYEVTVMNGNRRITVSNETTFWTYTPAEGEVMVTAIEQSGDGRNQSQRLRQLFESVSSEQTSNSVVLPLFQAFSPHSGPSGESSTLAGFWTEPVNVSYEGVERVSGRDAFVFHMESSGDGNAQIEQTLFVDTEHYVVLRGEWQGTVELSGQTEQINRSMRVTDIEFDPAVDDDIFEFDPPDNATVSRPRRSIDTFESYDALVSGTEKPVPSPQIPTEFEFDSGSDTTSAVSLHYTNGTATIFLTRRTTGGLREDAERVTRNGRTYHYISQYQTDTVQWKCNGAIYSLGGPLDRETLLQIGDSVECLPTEG
jgi:outer membrane lipoprotein-sorting protein